MRTLFFILVGLLSSSAIWSQIPYPGNDADHGVSRVAGLLDPYTGNVSFGTRDLAVAGAVGKYGLRWERHANSRTTRLKPQFGLGHNWSHNWQWELVDVGSDSQGRPVLALHKPEGWVHRFTQTESGDWWPEASVRERLVIGADVGTVRLPGGGEVVFGRVESERRVSYRVEALTDSVGNRWELTWEDSRLVRITEPAGRWISIKYETLVAAGGQGSSHEVIGTVETSDGQAVVYHYTFPAGDDYPVLSGATYPGDIQANYRYASPAEGRRALLVEAVDPQADRSVRGRTFSYRAESDAALGQIESVRGRKATEVWSALAGESGALRTYEVRTESGEVTYHRFNAGGNVAQQVDALGYVSSAEYDAGGRGFKVSTTDALGRVTRFERDHDGNITREIYPDGAAKAWTHDAVGRTLSETDELGQTRHYRRDKQGRVLAVTYPDGSTVETTYTGFGQPLSRTQADASTTRYEYDRHALRIATVDALGNRTTRDYDVQGRVIATTDARGNTTRFERDAAGNIVRTVFADGSSTRTEFDAWRQVTRRVDATGAARTFVYDELGRRVSSFDPLGGESRTEYAPVGDLGAGRAVRSITPGGRVTAMTYDGQGRLTSRTLAADTRAPATTRYTYDGAGRQIAVTDPRGNTTKRAYDERGRVVQTFSALNHVQSMAYDLAGRRVSQTDAKGNTTRWVHDVMGRVVAQTDALGHVTRKTYDEAGRLAVLIDAKGSVHRFEHDLLGRQTALVYPDGSRETTAFDAAGNKVATTNRAGLVRRFAYDERNREVRSEWSDGSQTIMKAYDHAGRMTLEDNGVSRITFAYDVAGRMTSETQDLTAIVTGGAFDPEPRVVAYAYDADGKKASLTYPDDSFVQYAYNARGQLAEILGDGIPPPIASYEYDEAGNATRMPRENQTETIREYDAENKVTEIVDYGTRRSPLSELDYAYDKAGNRMSTTAMIGGAAMGVGQGNVVTRDAYHYDATYQVTGADYGIPVRGQRLGTPTGTQRFDYDAVGNRTAVEEAGERVPYTSNALNQYVSIGSETPSYDRNGNLTSQGGWNYRYDAMNRLVEASGAEMRAVFYYDAKNRVVARSFNGRVQLNTYDNWNLIEERDGAGAQQARYVHGRRIDEVVVMINRHGTFYPHHDVLGNVTMLTDAAGKVVERYEYTVTGEVTVQNSDGEVLVESAVGNRWMFTGREWLVEVDLYDHRNRVYAPNLARFIQTDPIRFSAGDINIYRYVSNYYIGSTDPFGLNQYAIGGVATASVAGGSTVAAGVVYNSSAANWMDSVGIYGSVGGVVGVDVGVGAQATWIEGNAGTLSGASVNVNANVFVVGASAVTNIPHGTDAIGKLPGALSDPASGELIGGSVGLELGLPAGASVSFTNTGVITLGDVFRAIGGFFSWIGGDE